MFNTHLQASYSGAEYRKENHKEFEARLNQIVELSKFIRDKVQQVDNQKEKGADTLSERHSFLVAGDFNVRADCAFHPTLDAVAWNLCDTAADSWLRTHINKSAFSEYDYLKWALGHDWKSGQTLNSTNPETDPFLVENVFEKFCSYTSVHAATQSYLNLHY